MNRDILSADGAETSVSGTIFITASELSAMLKISNRTLWRMLSAKRLPEPIRVGGIVRWRMSEIDGWISAGCPRQS